MSGAPEKRDCQSIKKNGGVPGPVSGKTGEPASGEAECFETIMEFLGRIG